MVVRILDLVRFGAPSAKSTDSVRSRRSAGVAPPWRFDGLLSRWAVGGVGSWLSTDEDGSWWSAGAVRAAWLAATAALVVAALLGAWPATLAPFGGVGVLSAGYLASRKSVPSQALGTAGYVLGVLYAVGLQFGPALAALLAGHAAKRYAVRTHPRGTFRRPVDGASGYYYDPAAAGAGDWLLMAVVSRCLGWPVPGVGSVARLLLVGLDGVEVAASELAEDDVLYYLHRDSPGYVFGSDDATDGGRRQSRWR